MASGESSAATYARMDVETTEVAEQLSLCAPLLQRALDVEVLLQDEQVVELAELLAEWLRRAWQQRPSTRRRGS